MFTYFHCYMPETWEAQERCGLIDEHAGVRFCESLTIRPELKFNRLAAVDTPFYRMMEERRLPMYVDRLQGGCFFEDYQYDWELVERYAGMLGDRFLGFQLHEWVSNIISDVKRISECVKEEEWTRESIQRGILENYPFGYVFLEAQSPEEYASGGRPDSLETFTKLYRSLLKKRMALCKGRIVPCDSYALAYREEIKSGVRYFMPEVGAQTRDARLQVAYARGMARTSRTVFGVYYEPWGGEPFSSCSYQRDGKNEWGMRDGTYGPFESHGENGGSSRSLQKRIQIYAYFAGAEFFSEEWGMSNTFYDWVDFEMTPYGKIKYDFLKLIRKYPKEQIGTPYTPIAVVLPSDLPPVSEIHNTKDTLWGYPLVGELAKKTAVVREGLRTLLSNPVSMSGSETEILINSDIPDAIDVIHEDAAVLYEDYEYFVDLTGGGTFGRTHRCCSVEEVKVLLENLMPCTVEGGIHWFVNRAEGRWILVAFNHSGIHKSVEKGELALPGTERRIRIRLKNGHFLRPLEGDIDVSYVDGVYELVIPPGGWFLGDWNQSINDQPPV